MKSLLIILIVFISLGSYGQKRDTLRVQIGIIDMAETNMSMSYFIEGWAVLKKGSKKKEKKIDHLLTKDKKKLNARYYVKHVVFIP